MCMLAVYTGCSRRSCVLVVWVQSVLMSWSCTLVSTSTMSTASSVQSVNVVSPQDNTSACIATPSTARSQSNSSLPSRTVFERVYQTEYCYFILRLILNTVILDCFAKLYPGNATNARFALKSLRYSLWHGRGNGHGLGLHTLTAIPMSS